jgi:hypothetical protein
MGREVGGNLSPDLSWERGPQGTASYALACFDIDAPTPSGIWHWLLIDVPANVLNLPTGAGTESPAAGRPLVNDLGLRSYEGAAPPPGDRDHRYVFSVQALSVDRLPVPEVASASVAGFFMTMNTLARGLLIALA